jgi:DHA2 family methylenomycin A resistance protein-like MFS transporter
VLSLPLFRRKGFPAPALRGLVANVAFYGLIFVFSLYFQCIQGIRRCAPGSRSCR